MQHHGYWIKKLAGTFLPLFNASSDQSTYTNHIIVTTSMSIVAKLHLT